MTREECVKETIKHIDRVDELLDGFISGLRLRAYSHDKSKLESPELEIFVKYTDKLKNSTYGSDEYKQFLSEMKPALDHHYANNRHHPDALPNGIRSMNLLDIVEMFYDWKAASERHENGDIMRSIQINKERFGMSDELTQILINTAEMMRQ